jgi:hypothetical protein
MDREYDIFECLLDGSLKWRARVHDLPSARLKINELASSTGKEYLAREVLTEEVVLRVDESKVTVPAQAIKRIFQIAYTERLRGERAELLRRLGYGVVSVIGNDAAKALLSKIQYDNLALFIVGHAAPEAARKGMVDWLKAKYPNVKVLALNPPNEQLPDADYNVTQNGPEKWLPFISAL